MSDKCLYRSWTWKVNGNPCKAQACMPGGGLGDISELDPGDSINMGDGSKYNVVNCKWPDCQ